MSALRIAEVGDILIVDFTESKIIDETTVQQIGEELMDTVVRARGGKLLLNLSGITFMTSAMISEFIRLQKRCKDADKTMKICGLTDDVEQSFKLMQLHKLFDIHKDEKKAVGAFNKKKGWFG